MINKLVQKDSLISLYKKIPINYDNYIKWLDDDGKNNDYFIIATTNIEIRNEKYWNADGREIYDEKKVFEHAKKINNIIGGLKTNVFLIQHEYSASTWFPKNLDMSDKILKKIDYLKTILGKQFKNDFSGGLFLKKGIEKFIINFIDYPFLLRYKAIDCFSFDLPLLIKINHHLAINLITTDKQLYEKIMEKIKDNFNNYIAK